MPSPTVGLQVVRTQGLSENAGAPEDCGGLGGCADFLEKIQDTTPWDSDDPSEPDVFVWVGGYFNPTTFDPNRINIDHFWRKKW